MAGVKIDTGIPAHARPERIPTEKWQLLVREREGYIRNHFTYDCRCLLDWVRDAEVLWKPLGYQSADDLIAKGYKLEPEELRLAARWLEINCPEEAIGYPDVKNKAQQMAADETVKPLVEAVHAGPGRGKTSANSTGLSGRGSTHASYLVRRLKRDAPDIAEALGRGEYKSARAAGIAAGIVKVPPALEVAQKAYLKLSKREREKFAKWMSEQEGNQ